MSETTTGRPVPGHPALRRAVVDLSAVASNVERISRIVDGAQIMAVVKADGYGHGAVPVARTALEAGATWLGTADVGEALAVRAQIADAPILAWLHDADPRFDEAVERGIAIGASSALHLERAAAASATRARPASVHLKVDTGLGRNGIPRREWESVFDRARELELEGRVSVDGLFSHLSNADPVEDGLQLDAFREAEGLAQAAGLEPQLRHIAATAAALRLPQTRLDLVRIGIGLYGLSPFDDESPRRLGLRPALRLESRLISVKRVKAGTGVSYGYTYRAEQPTTLGLVPLGYADGIPRHLSNTGSVEVGGRQRRIVGRIAMDQFVVDLGDHKASVGDLVTLFGDPATGAPSAFDWAQAASTINYEIVTRLGGRVVREYA
ncbi:alanine racemase [Cnuibacter physcomitrellae]|uniref:alanine racemase n=1 Tax=Cnuibacter physcomitrellae TaxID=1619308 RepID=UPI002175FE98|nr:alanine racemase [Cnuibacter physcomitrellae]MCS5499232.1 alanine racemase [Cnuibacter physcomitrellae]